MKKTAEAFVRTLRLVASDRAALMTLVGAVVLYSFFYPTPYREQVAAHLPVVVVDQDRSPSSRALLRKTLDVRAIDVVAAVATVDEAAAVVAAGNAHAVLHVPAGFQRDLLRGAPGHVVIFAAGGFLSHSTTALTGLTDAVSAYGQDAGIESTMRAGPAAGPPLTLIRRPLFNTREGYGSTVVPAVAMIIVQQTLLLGIGLIAGTLRERGQRLAASPADLAGATAVFSVIGLLSLSYYQGFVFWYHDFPRAGNVVGPLVAAPIYILAIVFLGVCLGNILPTRERVFQSVALVSLPMFFLTNVTWPRPSAPPILTGLASLLPSTAGVTAMVKLNQMGAHLSEARTELWNLAALVLVYGALALWMSSRRRTS
jgi:ABC-2 type transport system permease protein